ncbi:IS630 family transposase [Natrialba swarupiae]|nr:IS630 family transposase [Natrialba swarupiae]
MATTVRELPANVVVRSNRGNPQTAGHSSWKTLGFYALLGKSTLIFRKRTTKESICAALEAIREQNPVGRILLVADNDGGHHAKLTQRRADELGIEFVFLPPYSPMFNAIEPLWKTLKRKISPEIFEGEDHFEQFVTNTFLTYPNALASPTTGSKRSSRIFKSYADHSCSTRSRKYSASVGVNRW